MKAEERKHLEHNELADRLGGAWKAIGSGAMGNTFIWGAIVVGLLGVLGYRYYARISSEANSALWASLDRANSIDQLKAVAKDNAGKIQARIARFQLSRFEMQDALGRLAGPSYEDRLKAADQLQETKQRYVELARESTDEPSLASEALMNAARAEETLAGVPSADKPEMRGSLDAAQKAYEEVATKYATTFLGAEAAKRAAHIRDHREQMTAFYVMLSKKQGKQEAPPPLPAPPSLPEAPKAEKPVETPPAEKPAETPKSDKPADPAPPKN